MKLITEGMLREMAAQSREIVLEPGSRLTPSARDLATAMGLTIIQECDRIITRESRRIAGEQRSSCSTGSEDDIQKLVQKVLEEIQKQICPNPKATHVTARNVKFRPFDPDNPGLKMEIAEAITCREANLAAGFMTFDRCELSWDMAYDEINYVIEGDYVLKVDGKVFRAGPGDVIYLPKGAHVVFSSPGFARVFYVTYPANWEELSRS